MTKKNETVVLCDTEAEWKNVILDFYAERRRFIARRYELIIRVLEGRRDEND